MAKLACLRRNASGVQTIEQFLHKLLSLAFNFNLPHTFAFYVLRLCS